MATPAITTTLNVRPHQIGSGTKEKQTKGANGASSFATKGHSPKVINGNKSKGNIAQEKENRKNLSQSEKSAG